MIIQKSHDYRNGHILRKADYLIVDFTNFYTNHNHCYCFLTFSFSLQKHDLKAVKNLCQLILEAKIRLIHYYYYLQYIVCTNILLSPGRA